MISKKPRCLTEIRNQLKLPFSTTHKYLKEMEAANILNCKEIKDKRGKKVYFLKRFYVKLDPKVISKMKFQES